MSSRCAEMLSPHFSGQQGGAWAGYTPRAGHLRYEHPVRGTVYRSVPLKMTVFQVCHEVENVGRPVQNPIYSFLSARPWPEHFW